MKIFKLYSFPKYFQKTIKQARILTNIMCAENDTKTNYISSKSKRRQLTHKTRIF